MSKSELKKLQAKWYKKLARNGFKDIEDTESERELLHTWDSLYFLSRCSTDQFHAKERYFQLASQFLESHVFETSWEKTVWTLYCAGISIPAIGRKFKKSWFKINKVVKALEEKMLGRRKNRNT